MSEFECKYGHLMSSRDHYCPICAEEGRPHESIYYMDGMTAHQLRMMERDEARRELQSEEDDKC